MCAAFSPTGGAGSTFPLCSDHRQTSQLPTYLLPSLPHVTPPSMPALPSALPLSLPSFNNPSPYLTSDLRIPPSQVVSNHPLVTSSNFFVLEDLLGWAEDERRPQRDSLFVLDLSHALPAVYPAIPTSRRRSSVSVLCGLSYEPSFL